MTFLLILSFTSIRIIIVAFHWVIIVCQESYYMFYTSFMVHRWKKNKAHRRLIICPNPQAPYSSTQWFDWPVSLETTLYCNSSLHQMVPGPAAMLSLESLWISSTTLDPLDQIFILTSSLNNSYAHSIHESLQHTLFHRKISRGPMGIFYPTSELKSVICL